MNTVYDKNHSAQAIGQLLAKGGEGAVHTLRDRNNIVVKLYFDSVLQKNGSYIQSKTAAMHALKGQFPNNLCWPLIPIFDQQKNWNGYAMYKFEGQTFTRLAHPILYKRYAPNLTRRDIATMMLKWLSTINVLHNNQVFIGDYNLENFMWNPDTLDVGFIDCDSYQIKTSNKTYACLVGSPDLTAPEQHGKSFKDIERTVESELFSIAIILFKCFMLGRHPYDIVGGSDPVHNIRQGNFAYGEGNNGRQTIPKGEWYKIWSHMPYSMKNLFIQTFTEGANNPSKRATVKQWTDAIQGYIYGIDKGFHETAIIPKQPKSSNHVSKESA